MILMHFINQTLMTCCIRSSAPPGRRAWAGSTKDTREDEPSSRSGTSIGVHHPLVLTGSATHGSCSSSGWHRGSGRG